MPVLVLVHVGAGVAATCQVPELEQVNVAVPVLVPEAVMVGVFTPVVTATSLYVPLHVFVPTVQVHEF